MDHYLTEIVKVVKRVYFHEITAWYSVTNLEKRHFCEHGQHRRCEAIVVGSGACPPPPPGKKRNFMLKMVHSMHFVSYIWLNPWDIEYHSWAVSLWAMSNKIRESHGNSLRVGNTDWYITWVSEWWFAQSEQDVSPFCKESDMTYSWKRQIGLFLRQ